MAVDGLIEQVAHEWRRSGRGVGVGGFSLEMTHDTVDDLGVGENRDDLHFRTTFAQEWVDLEHFSDQACPIGPARGGGRRTVVRLGLGTE